MGSRIENVIGEKWEVSLTMAEGGQGGVSDFSWRFAWAGIRAFFNLLFLDEVSH
jgi:hypothetical protein